MAQTVIGIFKDAADAQKALSRLEGKGISRQNVDVSRGEYLDATADREGRNTNRVTDFFNKLFGHDSDDARRYSTIGQRNVTIVTVHATSRDLAEEAADILDDCGAIDVDEHSGSSSGATRTEGRADISSDRRTTGRADDSAGARSNVSTGGASHRRSRIIDRSVDENYRLRGDF